MTAVIRRPAAFSWLGAGACPRRDVMGRRDDTAIDATSGGRA
ncbi:hypothetical protein [Streptomyces scabiei]|nr:hypothetical protein [Streptomyces scabiei]MDX3112646.1 hypothetical protein [Streptomyces scabiei]